jgi:hypothetical protein
MTNEYKPVGASDNSPDWFYSEWAANAPNPNPTKLAKREQQARAVRPEAVGT